MQKHLLKCRYYEQKNRCGCAALKLNHVGMLLTGPKLVNQSLMVQNIATVVNVELLSVLAARLCNPDDPKQGAIQIEAATAKLRMWVNALDWVRFPLTVIGAFLATAGIITVFSFPSDNSLATLLVYGWIAFWVVICCGAFTALRVIQMRKCLFVNHPYDARLPSEVEKLLLNLASGGRTAVLLKEYGVGAPDALRTCDGKLVYLQISSGTFLNRHAPLLASANKNGWPLVSLSLRHAFTRPIYVIREDELAEQLLETKACLIYNSLSVPVAAESKEGQKWEQYFLWNLNDTDFKNLMEGIHFYDDNIKQSKATIVLNAFYDGVHDENAVKPIKPGHLYKRAARALNLAADLMMAENPTDILQSAMLRQTGLTGKHDSIDWMARVLGGNYAQICGTIENAAVIKLPNFTLLKKYGVISS